MTEKENKSVYAKPTRRKVDGYRVWEIYDEKGTLLMNECSAYLKDTEKKEQVRIKLKGEK